MSQVPRGPQGSGVPALIHTAATFLVGFVFGMVVGWLT